jgi:glycine hydroxymethyltransferase
LILCRQPFADAIDRSVFPGLQGGPHMNTIAAVAVTLGKALEPQFREYAAQVLRNSKRLAERLLAQGVSLVTGGTDNHMVVVDTVKSFGIHGRAAEQALDRVGITTNKQVIPDDPNPPLRPSGIRIGTPAATTRGMREAEMDRIAQWLVSALRERDQDQRLAAIRGEVEAFCLKFPVPGLA